MRIQSTRVGEIDVSDAQLITFPRGLVGFAEETRYALLPADNLPDFYWLQSLDDAELAFLVTDPQPFFKDYDVPIREETQQDLNLADTKDGRVLVICNRVGQWLTGNLLGPLVINTATRLAQQVVVTEKKWTCRQPLTMIAEESAVAQAA